jgi:signal peptidase I
MTMPRPRIWYVAILVVLVLAPGAGCASGARITADSTCGDYLSVRTDERHAAAASISTDLHAYSAGSPMWGTSLDAGCGATPDTTLRTYFAGQLALDVPSVSMERTINVGDTVLVNTLAYTRGAPRRGEVVVFTAPQAWRSGPAEARFVKRVVGTGGDHVVCCDPQHRLVLNGRPLDEPYLYRDGGGRSDLPSTDTFDIVVPDGRLWVLGDHRSSSGDSLTQFVRVRDIVQATILVEAVVGKAFVVIDSRDHDEIHWLTVPSAYADIPDPHRP